MIDKVVHTIQSDGDFKGAVITILGVIVALAPYIALGFGCPVPKDVVWFVKLTGFLLMISGLGISFGHLLRAFSLGRQLRQYLQDLSAMENSQQNGNAAQPSSEPDPAKPRQS